MFSFDGKSILVTGGTGSFGRKFAEIFLGRYKPKKYIVFSRDELKQHEMRQQFPDSPTSPLRYFIGDVRDKDRMYRAFHEVDVVVHAAALKQVPVCEYNPFEAVKTNIHGAQNVIDAAIDNGVQRVMALSTDKAVNPVNLYGATKLCAEKMFVHGNHYSGGTRKTRFACTRYGNVVGSRGSVLPVFNEQRRSGKITVTDARMTRFWLTLEQSVEFVIRCIPQMEGGEVFVPKVPSMSVMELARAVAPDCAIDFVGIRPGEKLHEVLISQDEARHSVERDAMYVIRDNAFSQNGGAPGEEAPLPDGFSYTSDANAQWLSEEELKEWIRLDG